MRNTKWKNKYKGIFLVVGTHFSGSSLLTSIIGSHPDVVMLSEVRFFAEMRAIGKPYTGTKLIYPNQINQRVLDKYKSMGAKIIFIERDFENHLNSYMHRKRLSVVSKFNHNPIWDLIWIGLTLIGLKKQFIKRRILKTSLFGHSNSLYIVNYEELVKSPDKTIRKVCEYLGIKYSSKMLKDGAVYNHGYPRLEIK